MLNYPPQIGLVVTCDYETGFIEPEMVKKRLAVVVSPRLPHRDNLCTVVPLSTTASQSGIRYQCKLMLPVSPPPPFEGTLKWAKADMLATVSFKRLSLPYKKRPHFDSRVYQKIILPDAEMRKVHTAVLHSLGLDHLTPYI